MAENFPTLSFIENLAKKAGEILFSRYGTQHQVSYKGEIDLVTDVDRLSEQLLIGEINRSFPDHQILAEESGEKSGLACCRWYIDPLDGTVNYAHGIPIFCVSVAFAYEDEVRMGVVYDPMRNECYSAEKGKGAHLNGEQLQVSEVKELSRALLVTGFPYDIRTTPNNNIDHYVQFSLQSQGVRRLGSAALDLCYVASGRLDGYWEVAINPWDIAAGMLIVTESGGIATDFTGTPGVLESRVSVVAGNPAVHKQMMDLLNS